MVERDIEAFYCHTSKDQVYIREEELNTGQKKKRTRENLYVQFTHCPKIDIYTSKYFTPYLLIDLDTFKPQQCCYSYHRTPRFLERHQDYLEYLLY